MSAAEIARYRLYIVVTRFIDLEIASEENRIPEYFRFETYDLDAFTMLVTVGISDEPWLMETLKKEFGDQFKVAHRENYESEFIGLHLTDLYL